jgi:hypothetical protein
MQDDTCADTCCLDVWAVRKGQEYSGPATWRCGSCAPVRSPFDAKPYLEHVRGRAQREVPRCDGLGKQVGHLGVWWEGTHCHVHGDAARSVGGTRLRGRAVKRAPLQAGGPDTSLPRLIVQPQNLSPPAGDPRAAAGHSRARPRARFAAWRATWSPAAPVGLRNAGGAGRTNARLRHGSPIAEDASTGLPGPTSSSSQRLLALHVAGCTLDSVFPGRCKNAPRF